MREPGSGQEILSDGCSGLNWAGTPQGTAKRAEVSLGFSQDRSEAEPRHPRVKDDHEREHGRDVVTLNARRGPPKPALPLLRARRRGFGGA